MVVGASAPKVSPTSVFSVVESTAEARGLLVEARGLLVYARGLLVAEARGLLVVDARGLLVVEAVVDGESAVVSVSSVVSPKDVKLAVTALAVDEVVASVFEVDAVVVASVAVVSSASGEVVVVDASGDEYTWPSVVESDDVVVVSSESVASSFNVDEVGDTTSGVDDE